MLGGRWMEGWVSRCMEGRVAGKAMDDGWIVDRWMEGWVSGWMDGG